MVWGCGDYVTNSDLEHSEYAQQREMNELRARIDKLEEVFVSDVIINTDARNESGYYTQFGDTIDTESNWRYLEAIGDGIIRGGYKTKWTNNTGSDITVNVIRLVFEDVNGIQIAEDVFLERDIFDLDAGDTRNRSGNFSFTGSVTLANKAVSMNIWASFAER